MKRFGGLMPRCEVEREETLYDQFDRRVMIQAGPNGWSIIWSDGAANWDDNVATTEENFNIARNAAVDLVGELTEKVNINDVDCDEFDDECCEECCDDECIDEETDDDDDCIVEVEFTDEEIENITKRASAIGMSFEDYVIAKALGKDPEVDKLIEYFQKLADYVKKVHAEGEFNDETDETFNDIIKKIDEVQDCIRLRLNKLKE